MMNTIYIRRFVLAVMTVIMPTLTMQGQQIVLDREWYLAGEKMTIAVEVNSAEIASKVAYVELADKEGMQANAIIALESGHGQGCIYLPASLHSGNYQLAMYTRIGSKALKMVVPVVNIMQKTVDDDIDWVAGDGHYKSDLSTIPMPENYMKAFSQKAENEGHCVYARIRPFANSTDFSPSKVDATLAVVGKEMHVFQGRMLDDSTAVFNTYNVNGRHSIVVSAETENSEPLQIETLDPFANIVAKELPHLTFSYNRAEVEERSLHMQMALNDTMVVDSTTFTNEVFSTKPLLSYNLDEYRQFRTIREVLLEYVSFIQRVEKNGRNRLFVYSDTEGFNDWPALVLLDGMPVKNINRLLEYDARRVHYISIFDDYYTLGGSIFRGIICITTRTGKLTNFPPEPESEYIIYDFPQK